MAWPQPQGWRAVQPCAPCSWQRGEAAAGCCRTTREQALMQGCPEGWRTAGRPSSVSPALRPRPLPGRRQARAHLPSSPPRVRPHTSPCAVTGVPFFLVSAGDSPAFALSGAPAPALTPAPAPAIKLPCMTPASGACPAPCYRRLLLPSNAYFCGPLHPSAHRPAIPPGPALQARSLLRLSRKQCSGRSRRRAAAAAAPQRAAAPMAVHARARAAPERPSIRACDPSCESFAPSDC